MKRSFIVIVLIVLMLFPIKSYSQEFLRILDLALKTTETVLEVAEYVEIATVLISSEDNLEHWLNQTVNAHIQRNHAIHTSEWLTAIGDQLVAKCDRPYLPKGLTYNFYIIDEDYYNAFAVPGGSIYVTRALFEALNEEEMAFVLGHEIAHISYKHSVKTIKTSHAFLALKKIALKLLKADRDVEQLLELIAIGTYTAAQRGFSREWERDADKYGCHLAYLANFNPNGSVNALRKIANATGSWSSTCFLWDTHPAMTERVQLLNTEIAMLDIETIEERPYPDQVFLASTTHENGSVINDNQVFAFGYNSFIDRETSFKWEPHFDNPTSVLRYQLEERDYSKRLPRFDELISFFDKVTSEINTNNIGGMASQIRLLTDGNYVSSTETYSHDNRKYYKGISWNLTANSFKTVSLAPGDLVNIVFIRQ